MRGVAGMFVLLLLAGCATSPDAARSEGRLDTDDAASDPRIQAAGAPPNETVGRESGAGGEAHTHDGWGDAARLSLFSGTLTSFRDPTEETSRARIPLTGFVLEGASHVEVTLSAPKRILCQGASVLGVRPCSPPVDPVTPPGGAHLFFRHASSAAWIDAGPVTWGTPILVPIQDVTWTDMPHSGASLWGFDVRSSDQEDGLLQFDATVEVVRGEGEIPRWPGHPRFYDEETHTRELFRGQATTAEPGPTDRDASWRETSGAAPEKLVSWGTRSLVVWINVTEVTTPPGVMIGKWRLAHANATGVWSSGGHTWLADGSPMRAVVDLNDAGMDSPYADASRWRFVLLGDLYAGREGIREVELGGAVPYSATYDLRIVASDLPPLAWGIDSGSRT